MDLGDLGARLKQLREAVGLSQDGAAKAVGLNRVVLAYYENGTRQPSLTMLSSLARLYGTSLSDLLAEVEPAPQDMAGVLFRATSAEISDSAKGGMQLFTSLLDSYVELAEVTGRRLGGRTESPYLGRSAASRKDAARLAREVRDGLGLGEGPVGDHLFSLLDGYLVIFRLPLGSDLSHAPSGLFWNHPKVGFSVLINSDMTLGRQVFTLAHELCHALFHSFDADIVVSIPTDQSVRERFADWFAGELLVPSDGLARAIDELDARRSLHDPLFAVHLQRHFGVSYGTLLIRLRQERLLDNNVYAELREVSPSRLATALGYEVHAADMGDYDLPPLERIPARMIHAARSAVFDGTITRGDAAETLRVTSEDVLRMLEPPRVTDKEEAALSDMEHLAGFG